MDNRDILEQILGKLESLEQGQTEMGADIGEMGADVGEMRADVGEMRADIGGIGTHFTSLIAGQNQLQEDITAIKSSLKGIREDVKKLLLIKPGGDYDR